MFRIPATLLLAGVALAACDIAADAGDRAAKAETLLASGDYNEALVELKNALAKEPKNARVLVALARTHLQLGQFDAADKTLAEARAAGADAAQLDALRADVLLARNQPEPLLAVLADDSLALDDAQRRDYRIRALAALRRCEEALPLARDALAQPAVAGAVRVAYAECLARRGNTAAALTELEKALDANPRDAVARVALAGLMQVMGRSRDAEAAWRKAAESAPGQLTVPQLVVMYSALADAQVAHGDLDGLRATHQTVVEYAPGSGLADYLGANVTLLEGKADAAVPALQKLLVANRDFRPARVLLASALLAQGKLEQMRQEVHTLVQEAPEVSNYKAAGSLANRLEASASRRAEYWIHAAGVHAALGQPMLARAALAEALKIEPGSRDAQLAQAQLALRMGDVAGAARQAQELAGRFADDSRVRRFEADARAANGDFAGAAAAIEAVCAREPSGALAVAAYRLRARGGLADPTAPLAQWLATHPDDRAVREQYAEALRTAGDDVGAMREYEKIVAQRPDHVGALNNLAWLYHLKRDPRALATSRRAWDRAPKVPEIADTHGWILVESGAVTEGLAILATADAAAGHRHPEIRFHYASALARAGQRERAAALLADVVAFGGDFPSQSEARTLLDNLGSGQST